MPLILGLGQLDLRRAHDAVSPFSGADPQPIAWRLLFGEITAFEVMPGPRAMKFTAAAAAHDDLVLALSLAVFGTRLSQVSRKTQLRSSGNPG
ncbi:hypothetical protein [Mesorhizobium escarrei]|nr:hypothetical protein [Mesorhizobium escarrei]